MRVEQSVVVENKKGLHARPAAMLVQIASKYQAQVTLVSGGQQVNGKSIMGILTLGAQSGTVVQVVTEGPDAQEAMEALIGFFVKQEEDFNP